MSNTASFEVRNLRFSMGAEVPRYWHPAGAAVTRFFDNLSIFFPEGERFFVASVKAHRQLVRDPQLAADVRAFVGQEAMHTREHIRYNEMLRQQGVQASTMERRVRNLLRVVVRFTPLRVQLAATSALEHFTALIAHTLLSDARMLDGAQPSMAALWRWHAAEENEHKAVAFDVYQLAGGNYLERIAVMIATTMIFWVKVIEQQIRLMWADGTLFNLREWAALLSFLFVTPGGMRNMIALYFTYYRPRFHPWDVDNRDLLEAWKQSLNASAHPRRRTP